MRRESILLQSSIFCSDFLPPNSKLKYLYTYIKIGDKGDIHILYVYCIEMRSESCNYAFIDWRYTSFEFLKFQNFNIFSNKFVCKVQNPCIKLGSLLRKFRRLKNFLDPLLTFKLFCFWIQLSTENLKNMFKFIS